MRTYYKVPHNLQGITPKWWWSEISSRNQLESTPRLFQPHWSSEKRIFSFEGIIWSFSEASKRSTSPSCKVHACMETDRGRSEGSRRLSRAQEGTLKSSKSLNLLVTMVTRDAQLKLIEECEFSMSLDEKSVRNWRMMRFRERKRHESSESPQVVS